MVPSHADILVSLCNRLITIFEWTHQLLKAALFLRHGQLLGTSLRTQ